MSISLLEMENGGIEAASGNMLACRLDGLLADCLNCALNDVLDSAGRENEYPLSGQGDTLRRRRARLGGPRPNEHLDA